MDMVNHCSICGCESSKANINADKLSIDALPSRFISVFPGTCTYIEHVFCPTCTKKMVEYMELLKNASAWVNKPKPCTVCGSEKTEVVHDVDCDDNERWYAHCNDCGTSYSNEKVEWSEKETLKWWNELKR